MQMPEPDDPSLGYDIFVCNNCSNSVLVHHPTPESEDEDYQESLFGRCFGAGRRERYPAHSCERGIEP